MASVLLQFFLAKTRLVPSSSDKLLSSHWSGMICFPCVDSLDAFPKKP
jgi:hypothetical protein